MRYVLALLAYLLTNYVLTAYCLLWCMASLLPAPGTSCIRSVLALVLWLSMAALSAGVLFNTPAHPKNIAAVNSRVSLSVPQPSPAKRPWRGERPNANATSGSSGLETCVKKNARKIRASNRYRRPRPGHTEHTPRSHLAARARTRTPAPRTRTAHRHRAAASGLQNKAVALTSG